jgi:hypothetical protein
MRQCGGGVEDDGHRLRGRGGLGRCLYGLGFTGHACGADAAQGADADPCTPWLVGGAGDGGLQGRITGQGVSLEAGSVLLRSRASSETLTRVGAAG